MNGFKKAYELCQAAGAANDKRAFNRACVEGRISMEKANEAFRKGLAFRKTCLERDAGRYVECLIGSPNGWGQHIIDGVQSHEFLRKMCAAYGEKDIRAAVESAFIKAKEVTQ